MVIIINTFAIFSKIFGNEFIIIFVYLYGTFINWTSSEYFFSFEGFSTKRESSETCIFELDVNWKELRRVEKLSNLKTIKMFPNLRIVLNHSNKVIGRLLKYYGSPIIKWTNDPFRFKKQKHKKQLSLKDEIDSNLDHGYICTVKMFLFTQKNILKLKLANWVPEFTNVYQCVANVY